MKLEIQSNTIDLNKIIVFMSIMTVSFFEEPNQKEEKEKSSDENNVNSNLLIKFTVHNNIPCNVLRNS